MVIQIVICQGQLAINLRDIRKYKGPQKLKEKKKRKKRKSIERLFRHWGGINRESAPKVPPSHSVFLDKMSSTQLAKSVIHWNALGDQLADALGCKSLDWNQTLPSSLKDWCEKLRWDSTLYCPRDWWEEIRYHCPLSDRWAVWEIQYLWLPV